MKKLFTYLLILIVAGYACTNKSIKYVRQPSSLSVNATYANQEAATNMIAPYKMKLDAEMNEVLVISAEEFPKEKGKPETKLGNLVADLSMEVAQPLYKGSIDFCLLNFGGLRTSLPKGEITKGKIFELMPFENELVVVTLPYDSLTSIINYLIDVGGQPVSGMTIQKDEFGDILSTPYPKQPLKILTTDYLANGGDRMYFFSNPVKYERAGIKLRDAIIQYCINQNKKGKQLTAQLDGRITLEE